MTIPTTGFAHVRLTVTDLTRSRAFYDQLFGWEVAYEMPADADDATKEALAFLFGGLIYSFPGGLFGLRPVAPRPMHSLRTASAGTTCRSRWGAGRHPKRDPVSQAPRAQ